MLSDENLEISNLVLFKNISPKKAAKESSHYSLSLYSLV